MQVVPPVHDLYAVSNHMGSVGSGHYTSYCKMDDGMWQCCNDSSVYSVDVSQVVSPDAYLLFYRRRHERDADQGTVIATCFTAVQSHSEHAKPCSAVGSDVMCRSLCTCVSNMVVLRCMTHLEHLRLQLLWIVVIYFSCFPACLTHDRPECMLMS